MAFTNQKIFSRQDFELLTSSLKVSKKTLLESFEYEIQYEHISNKKKVQSKINNNLFVVGISFIIIGALFLLGTLAEISPLLIFIGIVFIAITFLTRKSTLTIDCYDGNFIELNFNNRNKSEVVDYADQIIGSSNTFLLKKYSKIDRDLPIDTQLDSLAFLRNREIINEQEFDDFKDQLLGRENKSKIGF